MVSTQRIAELSVLRVSRRCRCAGLMLSACILAPAIGFAQVPWTMTITPTMNPLPVGFCAAVQLTVLDASGQVPRNPLGARVTMADVDMAVTGASVVGQQIDPTHWQVCGCQGGSPGTVATVTATYPAQALAATSRVPGLALKQTATFVLSVPKGTVNPPACTQAAGTPITASPRSAATPTASPAPAPATQPVATALPPVSPAATMATAPAAVSAAVATGTLLPPESPPAAFAPGPPMVVVRTEFTLPTDALLLAPGYCKRRSYDNPSILVTDTALVTGQLFNGGGEHLRWSALASNGSVQITVCNNNNSVYGSVGHLNLSYLKVNILVLR